MLTNGQMYRQTLMSQCSIGNDLDNACQVHATHKGDMTKATAATLVALRLRSPA